MKKAIIIALSIAAALTSCSEDETNPSTDVNGNNSAVDTTSISTQINAFPIDSLNAEEILSLEIMREEEKLAHDVYTTLYGVWNVSIFTNIAKSEQTHTDAVLDLLNKYQLPDPVGNNAVGVFTDTTLQALYNQLVAQGSISLLDGYKVGATIEDLDIYDLNEWLTKVDNEDIRFVYDNLNKGSRNHMRSFYGKVTSSGGTYSAQYITQAELDAIINSPRESGSW